MASMSNAERMRVNFSKSLGRRGQRPGLPSVRSTIQRLGGTEVIGGIGTPNDRGECRLLRAPRPPLSASNSRRRQSRAQIMKTSASLAASDQRTDSTDPIIIARRYSPEENDISPFEVDGALERSENIVILSSLGFKSDQDCENAIPLRAVRVDIGPRVWHADEIASCLRVSPIAPS